MLMMGIKQQQEKQQQQQHQQQQLQQQQHHQQQLHQEHKERSCRYLNISYCSDLPRLELDTSFMWMFGYLSKFFYI